MKIEEIKIKSLGDLLDKATPRRSDKNSGRFRDSGIYRGCADSSWNLLSSLERLGGVKPSGTKIHLEADVLRNYSRYAHPYLPKEKIGIWEKLVIGQHHGLPTRLLDWSYSPLIAAHFATLEESKADRIVWKFDWIKAHNHFKIIPKAHLVEELDDLLKSRGINNSYQLFNTDSLLKDDFVCLLDPPSLDSRIIAQSGTFTLSTNKSKPLDVFLTEIGQSHTLTKYIIPQSLTSKIRDQLDMCSIDERRLFPGLDGVSDEITRFYDVSPTKD